MVNQLQRITARVVKLEPPAANEPRATAKAGLALIQALARRVGLAGEIEREMPARKDPTQGFTVPAALLALIHGLLSGGRGFSATEPLRQDAPLLALLGLERAPAAETVEQVIKYLAEGCQERGRDGLTRVIGRQARRLVTRSSRQALTLERDFVPVWGDGSLLEVEGQCFDAIKVIDGARGQLAGGVFVGPYLTGLALAQAGEGELTLVRRMLDRAVSDVLRPCKLLRQTLFLLDALYGDGPTLDGLERHAGAHYIVGARKLATAERVMQELPEAAWRDTGANAKRGWAESGVAQAWLQCGDWSVKRTLVCRRWKEPGEMIWHYAGVLTNLSPRDPRVARRMRQAQTGFEEVVWSLYSRKQGLENQWKELLMDLGLHHPPCARAAVNTIFYGVAALAYNLAVGVRLIALDKEERGIRLWRFRRDWLDVAGRVARHGRRVVVRLLTACDERIDRLLAAMDRLARC